MDKHFYYCIAKDKEAFICCIIPNRLTHMGLLLRFFKKGFANTN